MRRTNSALQRCFRTDMRKLKGVYEKAGSWATVRAKRRARPVERTGEPSEVAAAHSIANSNSCLILAIQIARIRQKKNLT